MSGTILISGASSIIGKPLLARLRDRGDKFIEISRSASDDEHSCCWNLETQKLSETSLVTKALDKDSFDTKTHVKTMVHCAPIWLLAKHLPDLISLGIQRLIVFSSTSIDGKLKSTSAHEQHIVKLLKDAETDIWQQAQAHNIDVTIFRPTMIYGYGSGFNLAFIAKIISRFGVFPVVFGANGLRQPVHADDLANAVCLALPEEKTVGKTYVISGQEVMSYDAMVRRVFMALEKKPKIIKLPLFVYRTLIQVVSKLMRLPVDPSMADRMQEDLNFDNASARTDFAYEPMKFLPNGLLDILPEQDEES